MVAETPIWRDRLTAKERAQLGRGAGSISLTRPDILVIGAPMYNFSIHSTLKAWLDHIVRAGQTFTYSEKGIEGLVKGKKVYVALASGGIYSEGLMKGMDFVEPYLRAVLGAIGLTDITFVRAEGLNMPGVKEEAMEKAIASIRVD